MCSLPFFSFSPILVIFWLLYQGMELETHWLMTNPMKNLELLAFDFSLDHIYYSCLGTASGSLVPKLETVGDGDKSISRGLIDEKTHFCNVPRERLQCSNVNSEIYVTFQGITAITSGQGSGTPVQGVFLSLLPPTVVLPINLVLGDWSEGRNGAKATQRQMAEDEVLGRKFLRKVCILAQLLAFFSMTQFWWEISVLAAPQEQSLLSMRTWDGVLSFSLKTRCPLSPNPSALAQERMLNAAHMCQRCRTVSATAQPSGGAGAANLSPRREIHSASFPTYQV